MGIVNTLPNTILQQVDHFDKSMLFSTTEKMVGQWVDGKPIYKKTINFGALPNATTKSVAHGIGNLENIIDIRAWTSNGTASSSIRTIIPYVQGNDTHELAIYVTGVNVSIVSYADKSPFTNCYVTLQYTKTTDTALSYEIGTENDYSTSERLVGTWIDGKPVYQKTIQDTFPNTDTDGTEAGKYIQTGVSIDRLIDISLTLKKANRACFSGSMFLIGTYSAGYRVFCFPNSNSEPMQKNNINLINSNTAWNGETVYITFQYTKTTD